MFTTYNTKPQQAPTLEMSELRQMYFFKKKPKKTPLSYKLVFHDSTSNENNNLRGIADVMFLRKQRSYERHSR